MRLLSQFRALDDPSRFTWIREFPDMSARERSLTTFYSGPVWRTHREAANGMMLFSDNVLLLKPAGPGKGLQAPANRPAAGATLLPGLVDGHTHVVILGGIHNTFPRLPVREGEKLFVWFTRADSSPAYAAAVKRLEAQPGWKAKAAPALADKLESAPVVRRLAPTPRSALR